MHFSALKKPHTENSCGSDGAKPQRRFLGNFIVIIGNVWFLLVRDPKGNDFLGFLEKKKKRPKYLLNQFFIIQGVFSTNQSRLGHGPEELNAFEGVHEIYRKND